jgi:NAD(P)-dependent dehydrogenase (short-subunit alcohol dehydrogenase family)
MPRALVTGALGAIGGATARVLHEAGWNLVLLDRVDGESPVPPGEGIESHTIDLTDHDAVRALVGELELDAVIGVAGIGPTAPFLQQDVEGWRTVFEVNLVANMVLTQAAARRWVESGTAGSVVLVSSWIDSRPWPGTAAYSSSKAALAQFARSAALELAPYGIRVNTVAPGILGEGMAGKEATSDPEYERRAAAAVPLGHLQTADNVARAISYLVQPSGAYTTGTTLVIDGGASLVSGAGVLNKA